MPKLHLLTILVLVVVGILLMRWLLSCPNEIYFRIGTYESKEAGIRAAIKKLPAEMERCPKAKRYRIVWSGPTPMEDDGHVDRRALLYDRQSKALGYERDVLSGIDGKAYFVDDAAIRAVAQKDGTLEDFAEYDEKAK